MAELHANIFTGVLETDTDIRAVSNENFIDAKDVLNGFGATPGAAVFPSGNTQHVFALPSGTNVCIGAPEDKQTKSLFRFVYNSNGDHQIIQYQEGISRVVAKGEVLGFNPDWKITHAKIVDGKLLYWTDSKTAGSEDRQPGTGAIEGNPPRKTNVLKGDTTKENFEYEVYAGIPGEGQFANTNTYRFSTTDVDGGDEQDVNTYTADGGYLNLPDQGLQWLESLLNIDYPDLITDPCDGCKLKITYANGGNGRRLKLVTNRGDVLLVGTNIYPPTLEEHHIDLLKEPPHCAPSAKYVYDSSTSTNKVRRLCAQFRCRYIYDDLETSVWGPVSNIALNTDVNGEVNETLNAIQIDFTDVRLSDPSWLTMIREIELAFRDGNSNDWLLIDRIPVCEIGIGYQRYTFRNDRTYATIPSDELSTDASLQVLKPFDHVPLKCGTLEVSADSQGRTLLFTGACLDDYDNPDCIDITVEPVAVTEDCLIDIEGTVEIVNDANFPADDPDYDGYALGGFVVYLAGTNYWGISDNPADGTGTGAFRITGVPKGKYILRVASFKCSFSNDRGPRYNMGNGFEWQRTSAPVIDLAGAVANGKVQYEREVDLSGASATFDLDTETGYGPVQIQNQHWARRLIWDPGEASPQNSHAEAYVFYEIYLMDNEEGYDSVATRQGAISVERQDLILNDGIGGLSQPELVTDHNGYAFYGEYSDVDDPNFFLTSLTVNGNAVIPGPTQGAFLGDFSAMYDETMNNDWTSPTGFAGLMHYFPSFPSDPHDPPLFYTYTLTIFNDDTLDILGPITIKLNATIDDATTPLAGVLFNYTRTGRSKVTGIDGSANIVAYFPPSGLRDDDDVMALHPNDPCYDGYPAADGDQVTIDIDTADLPFFDVPVFTFFLSEIDWTPQRYLKGGGEYDFAIVYEDRGNRTPGAIRIDTLSVPVHPDGLTKWGMYWEIRSTPPDWATHYRIVRLLNAVHRTYVQWTVRAAQYVRIPSGLEDPIQTSYEAGDATHILLGLYVPVDDATTDEVTTFFTSPDGQAGYVPQEGDRVRLILDETGAPLNTSTSTIEVEILGVHLDADGQYFAIVPNSFGSLNVKQGFLAEYFSPTSVDSGVYYEGGEDCYEIGDAGLDTRYHKGPIDDQVPGVSPATGNYTSGDTYWRRQLYTETGIYATEHQSPNRLSSDVCQDIGRAFAAANGSGQQFFYNRIRLSGAYIPNSLINGLSSFSGLDYIDINRQFGVIKWLGFADNVLLALCQFKVQPIYINQQEVLYLDNSSSLGRSERILNIAKDSVSEYGTENPESVVSENGRVFFWDAYNGHPCRYAGNGVQSIANANINYFSALGKEREPFIDPVVLGGYDRDHDQYLLTFMDEGTTEEVTMGFDETKGGWGPKHSFIPEFYGRVGSTLVTFKNGHLWTHGDNVLYANYYGVQYKPYITFVVNTSPAMTKLFQSIRIDSNKKFEVPEISIPANVDYASGMESVLKANHINAQEGKFYANFLRDMNDTDVRFAPISPLADKQATAMIQGRRLRGEVMTIKIQAVDGSVDTKLTRVDVYFVRSEVSHP